MARPCGRGPSAARSPPHCSSRTGCPGAIRTASADSTSETTSSASDPRLRRSAPHRHDRFTFPKALQDRRRRPARRCPPAVRLRSGAEPRARAFELELCARHAELGGTPRFFGRAQRRLRRFELFRRDQPGLRQLPLAFERCLRPLERGLGARPFCLHLPERRAGGIDRGPELGLASGRRARPAAPARAAPASSCRESRDRPARARRAGAGPRPAPTRRTVRGRASRPPRQS